MASTINAKSTGSGSLESTADASGVLALQTGGVTAMTIDTSQNVGIGTTSPNAKLQVNGDSWVTDSAGTSQLRISPASSGVISFNANDGTGGTYGSYIFNTRNGATTTERMRIDSSGNVLVGTSNSTPSASNPGVRISLPDTASIWARNGTSTVAMINFVNGNGTVGHIDTSGSNTSYVTSSDYRLKENIVPMTGALEKIAQLNPVNWTWKIDGADGEGFIAHELAEVCPHAVSGEKDAVDEEGTPLYQGVDTSFLVATLTAAIQELAQQNQELKSRIEALEGAK